MGQITTAPDGTQIYYTNGQAINAKTGAPYAPASPAGTGPAPVNGDGGAQPGADPSKAGQPGYDVFGNAVAGAPLASGGADATLPGGPNTINRSIAGATDTTGADAAETYLDTFQAPQTADQIAEQKRQQSQGLIDATNKTYDDKVAADTAAGTDRVNQNNSVSVLSGLMGSTAAVGSDQTVKDANSKVIAADNDQRAQALAAIYSKITDDAATEAEQQKQDATASAQDIVTRRAASQAQALQNVQQLAASGSIDYNSFKTNPANAQVYQYALAAAGGSDDALAGIFAASRPKDSLVGTPQRVGDHYVQAYQNPLTGKVSYDTVQVPGGLPDTYNNFQTIGSPTTGQRIYAIPDNWDGDTSELKLVASTTGTGAGGTAPGYNGDFASTISLAAAANKNASAATRDSITKDLQTSIASGDYASAYQTILQTTKSNLTGTTATRFENALTLGSTLGDLQTALQSYADAGGNTNILTGSEDDIQTKLGTLLTDPKYASLAVQLDSAYQNYRLMLTGANFSSAEASAYASVLPQKGNTLALNLAKIQGAQAAANSTVEGTIKGVVGQGGIYIKQYAEGATPPTSSSTGTDLASQVKAKGYDYDSMKADGYSDDDIKQALGL